MKLKRYILMIAALVITLPMVADDAKSVLDRAAAAVERSNGIEAAFKSESFQAGSSIGSSTGTIQLKGEKFRLQSPDAISWFDGKTQWSYQKSADEVTVSNPTDKELESVNPYRLLSIYKSGYNSRMLSAKSYGGKAIDGVLLTATDKKRNFAAVLIYVSKSTNLPLFIRVTMQNGSRTDIIVTSCTTGTNPADTTFSFNKKEYPTAEVIDLR